MDLMRARVALRERPLLDVLDLAIRFCAAHARRLREAVAGRRSSPRFAVSLGGGATSAAGGSAGRRRWSSPSFAGAPFVALASRLVFADAVRHARGARHRAARRSRGSSASASCSSLALGASAASSLGLPWFWLGHASCSSSSRSSSSSRRGVGAHARARAAPRQRPLRRRGPARCSCCSWRPIGAAMLADVAGREILQGLLEVKPPPSMFHAGGSWLALAGWWAVAAAAGQTARFFVYLDIRTRTEGWDIQTRFAAIAARAEAESAGARERSAPRAPRRARGGRRDGAPRGPRRGPRRRTPSSIRRAPRPTSTPRCATGDYPFCQRAARRPSRRRRASSAPHASAIPGCAGFAAACAKATAPPPLASVAGGRGSGRACCRSRLPRDGRAGARLARSSPRWSSPSSSPIVRAHRAHQARATRSRRSPTPRARRRGASPLLELPMTDRRGGAPRARATSWRAAGQLRGRPAAYLAASLRALDKRGAVRIARDRTNGEYVRGCARRRARSPPCGTSCARWTACSSAARTRRRTASTRAAQRAMAIVRARAGDAARAGPVAARSGCGGASRAKPRAPGDDPAGGELFRDVLRRQGVNVAPLETLARVPAHAEGRASATPAVVVDLERTDLDDDTRDAPRRVGRRGRRARPRRATRTRGRRSSARRPQRRRRPHKITVRRLLAARRRARTRTTTRTTPAEDRSDLRAHDASAASSPTGDGAELRRDERARRLVRRRDDVRGGARARQGLRPRHRERRAAARTPASPAPGTPRRWWRSSSNADRAASCASPTPRTASRRRRRPSRRCCARGSGSGLVARRSSRRSCSSSPSACASRARRPAPPPRRRAFAEHVEAVGALYARTRNAPHALAAYARFADERLRARMPRGTGDVAAFLASRAGMPLDAAPAPLGAGDAGARPARRRWATSWPSLRELSAVYAAAMAQERTG